MCVGGGVTVVLHLSIEIEREGWVTVVLKLSFGRGRKMKVTVKTGLTPIH